MKGWLAGFVIALIPAAVQAANLEEVVNRLVATRTPNRVYVYHVGQNYHRHDHLLSNLVFDLTVEEARSRGYLRCAECLPPQSSEELNREARTARRLTPYYRSYLNERTNPTDTTPPPGALPGAAIAGPKLPGLK
jgi:hypothetical protein